MDGHVVKHKLAIIIILKLNVSVSVAKFGSPFKANFAFPTEIFGIFIMIKAYCYENTCYKHKS